MLVGVSFFNMAQYRVRAACGLAWRRLHTYLISPRAHGAAI